MFQIWFYGFIFFLIYRTFHAGMNTKKLFYRQPRRYSDETGLVLNDDAIFGYAFRTLILGVTWPLSLPGIGIFTVGRRLNKEAE